MNLTTTLSAALLALAAAGAAAARPVVVEHAPALAAPAVEQAYCHAGSPVAICGTPGAPAHRAAGSGASASFSQLSAPAGNEEHTLAAQSDRAAASGAHVEAAAQPVPEPKAYWMLLVGLGLLGLSASRREASNKFSA